MTRSIRSFLNYLEIEKGYSQHTLRAYKDDLIFFENYLNEVYKDDKKVSIEKVDYAHIRSWIVLLNKEGKVNKTINRKVSSLSAYYKFLHKIGDIPVNPIKDHKSLKIPKRVNIPFSIKEVEQVLELLEDDKSFTGIRDRLLIEFFYCTGLRKSELIALRVSDVDFDRCTVKVLGKGNKVRLVPLLPILIKSIRRYQIIVNQTFEGITGFSPLFLTKKGLRINQSLVYRVINSYFRKVSTKLKCSPHVLRHTFATHLLDQGADLNSLKDLLGHSTLSATQIYLNSDLVALSQVYKDAHVRNKK